MPLTMPEYLNRANIVMDNVLVPLNIVEYT